MSWRKPDPNESGLLRALLALDFPGRDALLRQMEGVSVRELDDEGSLELRVLDGAPAADVLDECPVDAVAADRDGVQLRAYLHVEDGRMSELELIKADGSEVEALPPAQDWKVVATE